MFQIQKLNYRADLLKEKKMSKKHKKYIPEPKFEYTDEDILDLQIILRNSIYCILYCLMKDIEKNRSLDRGLYELRLKIFQCKKFPC